MKIKITVYKRINYAAEEIKICCLAFFDRPQKKLYKVEFWAAWKLEMNEKYTKKKNKNIPTINLRLNRAYRKNKPKNSLDKIFICILDKFLK